jgi:hypothetical protein
VNRQEQEFSELSAEIRSVGQASAASLEPLSDRANNLKDRLSNVFGIVGPVSMQTQAHERLDRLVTTTLMRISHLDVDVCHQTDELAAVRAVTESTEKGLALTQVRFSRGECDFRRLASEVQTSRVHNEAVAKQLSSCGTKVSPLEANVYQIKTTFELFKTQNQTNSIPSVIRFADCFRLSFAIRTVLGETVCSLWRGSRDGFDARDFHSRCDAHANALTLILDRNWNILGGFTPVKWESCGGKYKCDNILTSFLSTLKNPHNTPAMSFALKPEKTEYTIYTSSLYGPIVGGGHDLRVCSQCNTNTSSDTLYFGHTYTNNSGVANDKLFTGSIYVKVKEIEVFEITT